MLDLDYNPFDREFQRDPYPFYRRLRDEAPVHYSTRLEYWVVSRYDDVVSVCNQPQIFSSAQKKIFASSDRQVLAPRMDEADDPLHATLRKSVAQVFTRKAIARMEDRIRKETVEVLNRLTSKNVEIVSQFNQLVPMTVVSSDLLGLPEELWDEFRVRGQSLSQMDPANPQTIETAVENMQRMTFWFDDNLPTFLQLGRDDVMSVIVRAWDEGVISRQEAASICSLMVLGGSDTSINVLGNTMIALTRFPDQLELVMNDPSLIAAMVEESLRWEAPVSAMGRCAARDTQLRGQSIREGDQVLIVFASANRDERKNADPDRFDMRRENRRSVAFGHGAHFCLGAWLARLEARVAFEEFFRRYENWNVVDSDIKWIPSGAVRGPATLNLELIPRRN